MIYTRFVFGIIVILLVTYYIMVVGQLFDMWKLTTKFGEFLGLALFIDTLVEYRCIYSISYFGI